MTRTTIKRGDCMKHGLGWKRQHLDPRDLLFAASPQVLAALPTTVDLRPGMPPIYDQGQLGSCTGNAWAAMFDFERDRQGLPFMTPSRLFVYYDERKLEGTTGQDAGAEIRDGAKALAQWGVCPESEWPYNIAKFAAAPPSQDYTDALNNQLLQYATVQQTAQQIMGTLASGYPICYGFLVFDAFEQIGPDVIVPMPSPSEQPLGGHANVLCGYDATMTRASDVLVLTRNSWGTSWGEQGYAWMPMSYLTNGNLASDFWMATLVEQPGPTPTPVPPVPVVDPADSALYATAGPWSKLHHEGTTKHVATAIQTWAKAKGLE